MTNQDDNAIELATYDNLRQRFRYHWEEGRRQAKDAYDCVNGMIVILSEENPDWSMNKILDKIVLDNQDLEGFSKRTIRDHLSDENRSLIDTSKAPKKTRSDVGGPLHPSSVQELTKTVEVLKVEIEKRDDVIVDLEQKLVTVSQIPQPEPTPKIINIEPEIELVPIIEPIVIVQRELNKSKTRIEELAKSIEEKDTIILKVQKELQTTERLLREERAKNEELNTLTDKQSEQIQYLSRRLTILSTVKDGEKPQAQADDKILYLPKTLDIAPEIDGKKIPICVRIVTNSKHYCWINHDEEQKEQIRKWGGAQL